MYLAYTAVHTPLAEEEEWYNDPVGRIKEIQHSGRRAMAASAYHLDSSIQRVIEALEETNQRANTLVVFSSDNGGITREIKGNTFPAPDPTLHAGFSSNGKLRGQKTEVYEGGIRVPAFVNWPGVLESRTVTAPMHIVDWLPTFAALTGIRVNPDLRLDGQNVWPIITGEGISGESAPAERTLYFTWGPW